MKIGFLQLAHTFFSLWFFFRVILQLLFCTSIGRRQELTFAVADTGVGVTPGVKNKSSKYSEGYTLEKNTPDRHRTVIC